MPRHRPFSLLLPALLTGCAVGPEFHRPPAPEGAGYRATPLPAATASSGVPLGQAQAFHEGADIAADWWTAFGSPALSTLVQQALAANPNITAAEAAVRQAQALVAAQRGFFFPTIGGSYGFSRQQLAGNTGGNSPGLQGNGSTIQASGTKPAIFNFSTAQLNVAYSPDIFGLVRRNVEQAIGQRDYQRWQWIAARITLATNVVAAALQEAALRAEIDTVRDIIRVNRDGLTILQAQYRAGTAQGVDLAAQEAAVAAAEALLPPLATQVEQTRDLLRALTGRLPNEEVAGHFELADIRLPTDLPVSLPSSLVDQRPDIRAAEAQLRIASAAVGVAIANRLPVVTLTANAGGNATLITQMFQPGGPFYLLGAGVAAPLFDGFSLLNQQRAAQEGLVQAAALYRATVVTAYQQVADVLHALVGDAEALRAAVAAETAARTTLDLTRVQARVGAVPVLVLLQAQGAWEQAVLTRLQAQVTRLGDTIALYQALGGGWWHAPTDPPQRIAEAGRSGA